MKIGLQTWGSDGDIRPFLALAGGLRASGHDVTLVVTSVVNSDYGKFAKLLGFKIKHVGRIDYDDSFIGNFTTKMRRTRLPISQIALIFRDFFNPFIAEMYEAAQELCRDNDLVIGHFAMHPLQAAAEKSKRPYATVTLNHSAIESKFTTPYGMPAIGRWANPLSWKFVHLLVDMVLQGPIDRLRQQEGLAKVRTLANNIWTSHELNLIAVSPVLCQRQPDWGGYQQVCGFFNVPEFADDWTMPAELDNFLSNGSAPVYLTFGSMNVLGAQPGIGAEILVNSVKLAGCRAIVQARWHEIDDIAEDENIYRITSAPHRAIFPRCAAVVHHGGAGTTHSASRYGCPSIIVEHFADQSFWAAQLKRIGIAPRPLHIRNLTADKLARAIKKVIRQPQYKEMAEKVGAEIRSEHGVNNAVQLIEKIFTA